MGKPKIFMLRYNKIMICIISIVILFLIIPPIVRYCSILADNFYLRKAEYYLDNKEYRNAISEYERTRGRISMAERDCGLGVVYAKLGNNRHAYGYLMNCFANAEGNSKIKKWKYYNFAENRYSKYENEFVPTDLQIEADSALFFNNYKKSLMIYGRIANSYPNSNNKGIVACGIMICLYEMNENKKAFQYVNACNLNTRQVKMWKHYNHAMSVNERLKSIQ